MRLIAHRGNINGPEFSILDGTRENTLDHLLNALGRGYDVEVDVMLIKDKMYAGHDLPLYDMTGWDLPIDRTWYHCKNVDAFVHLSHDGVNAFMHDSDDYAFTTHGYLWANVGRPCVSGNSVQVLPEQSGWRIDTNAYAVCTDYCEMFRCE